MKRNLTLVLLLFTVVALIWVPQASANDQIKGNFTTLYGVAGTRIDSCDTCHTSQIPSLNLYGTDLRNNASFDRNNSIQAMKNIEPLDSDGDGFTNINEIHNLTFPGNASDFPPVIISFSPASPVTSNPNGPAVTFTVKVNQPASVTWFLDGAINKQENTNATNESSDSITPSSAGTHNVSAVALKTGDGSAMQTWVWNVTPPANGSISGTKFNDINNNSVRDEGEPGLANWTIVLTKPDGTTENMMTDANGNYTFSNLPAGTYTVGEVLQAGWMQTAPQPVPPGTYTVPITAAGENVTGKDFGNMQVPPGSISGMKFNDTNGNGIKDANESGLADWTIVLTRPNGTTENTTTDANGNYTFGDLSPGTYMVGEVLQAGWKQTAPPTGTYTVPITPAGENVVGIDFGNTQIIKPGSISGMKFNDTNGDGVRQANEEGLADWTIMLTKPDGTTENTTTDANGNYTFVDLSPGTYIVGEILQPGWMQTAPQPVPPGTYNVTLASGENATGLDFGNTPIIKPGSISGMKFNDTDGDGMKDMTESGLENWTIVLTRPEGTKETTMTDANGNYTFSNLPAGTYTVGEVLKPNWTQTAPKPIPPGTYTVTITPAGENVTGKDFGNMLVTPAVNGSISGFKINDTNGNGMLDAGETGLPGWKIKLRGIDPQTFRIKKQTTTDSNGFYTFDNLPAGRYIIIEKLKKGFVPTSSPVKVILLAKGENSMNNNFTNMPLSIHGMDEDTDMGDTGDTGENTD